MYIYLFIYIFGFFLLLCTHTQTHKHTHRHKITTDILPNFIHLFIRLGHFRLDETAFQIQHLKTGTVIIFPLRCFDVIVH